jgi:hypothetical protein
MVTPDPTWRVVCFCGLATEVVALRSHQPAPEALLALTLGCADNEKNETVHKVEFLKAEMATRQGWPAVSEVTFRPPGLQECGSF